MANINSMMMNPSPGGISCFVKPFSPTACSVFLDLLSLRRRSFRGIVSNLPKLNTCKCTSRLVQDESGFIDDRRAAVLNQMQFLDAHDNGQAEGFASGGPPDMLSSTVDSDLLRIHSSDNNIGQTKAIFPPRVCTLRAFGKTGEGVIKSEPELMSAFFKSLAASIEISTRIRDWEILSGRLAMVAFASAILTEALTGNTVFGKIDIQRLEEVAAVCTMSVLVAAGFAVAWRAKVRVTDTMSRLVSKGCEDMVNSVIDNIVDGLFFEDHT